MGISTQSLLQASPLPSSMLLSMRQMCAHHQRCLGRTRLIRLGQFWYQKLVDEVPDLVVHYDVEPFLQNVYSQAASDSSAWPPRRDQTFMPMLIYYGWSSPDSDELVNKVLQQSTGHLTNVAVGEGQDIANTPLYNNYALYSKPAEKMYGKNLGRLWWTREKYDPRRVMDLAGGWKF